MTMWIKDMTDYLTGMKIKYGVTVEISVSESKYDPFLTFTVSKGQFHARQSMMLETIHAMGDQTSFFEGVLEEMAEKVVDAYDSTNKSKAWNETLQDIGVREG